MAARAEGAEGAALCGDAGETAKSVNLGRPVEGPAAALGLPIRSRQEQEQGKQSGSCQVAANGQCGPFLTLPLPKPKYLLDTITTPSRRRRRLPTLPREPPLPRWAQPFSASGPSPSRSEGTTPPPVSRASSLTSSQQMALEVTSEASFMFAPEVFVQMWHRKLSEMYVIINIVGEGRSGVVFIVQHRRTEKYYACKFLRKADHDPDALMMEIQTLRRLDHPNIVRLYEVNEDDDAVFLLMELCRGGDLCDRIREEQGLGEADARMFAQQMLSALGYCHANGVVHRDVKPENFLLERPAADEEPDVPPLLKLADFGIATCIRPTHVSSSVPPICSQSQASSHSAWPSFAELEESSKGSLPYMAPEMFRAQPPPHVLGAADLWSAGVTIYVMLSNCFPFGEDISRICSGRPPDFSGGAWADVSPDVIDLIRRLLNPLACERPTAQQALAHQWFREASTCGAALPDMAGPLGLGSATDSPNSSDTASAFAGKFLQVLRRWRATPKLRRIIISAIARKLEEQHETHRHAQAAHAFFGETSETLRCDRLVEALKAALRDHSDSDRVPRMSEAPAPSPLMQSTATGTSASSPSPVSAPARLQRSRTGLHVRRRMRNAVRSLTCFLEESPAPTPGSRASSSWPDFAMIDVGTCASLTELRYLVAALDAQKDGAVDYTLLVASLLPAEVYSAEDRVSEAFDLFDVQKRGAVSPRDLWLALQCKGADYKQLQDMVAEFDYDGDGRLNYGEFRAMVCGHTHGVRLCTSV